MSEKIYKELRNINERKKSNTPFTLYVCALLKYRLYYIELGSISMRDSYGTDYSRDVMVYGNTARELAPNREKRVYRDGKRVRESERELRNRDKALQMNGPYVFFLAAVSVFCLSMSVVYLGVQSEIANTRKQITKLKNDISTLTAKNEAMDYAIQGYVSSDYVIQVATSELGMVEADSEQVAFYKSSDSEYTVQFKDIPTK